MTDNYVFHLEVPHWFVASVLTIWGFVAVVIATYEIWLNLGIVGVIVIAPPIWASFLITAVVMSGKFD